MTSGRLPRAVGLLVSLLALSRVAAARDYDVEVRVSTVEDLYELQYGGDLEADDVELLIALFERPLDINRADRELLYDLPAVTYALADAIVAARAAQGAFASVADLAAVPGITSSVFAQLEPFVTVTVAPSAEDGLGVRGRVETGALWLDGLVVPWDEVRTEAGIDQAAERLAGPQAFLVFDVTGLTYYGVGGLLTYRRVTPLEVDADGAFGSPGTASRPRFDKLYAFATFDRLSVIVGSYNVGFGQRLTFNSLRSDDPHGWREDSHVRRERDDGKLAPMRSLFGAAVTVNELSLGEAWLDATAFVSRRNRDIYQYSGDVTDIGDISADDDIRFATLEDLVRESLAGGNLTLHLNEDVELGVTGYGARSEILDGDAARRFSVSSGIPNGDYGAVGVDGAWRVWRLELGGEYARTFARGDAAYLRSVVDLAWLGEASLELRHYSHLYENPSANPRAARDQAFGRAARNERGVRAQAALTPVARLRSVTTVDLWQNPYRDADADTDDQVVEWARRDDPPTDLLARERLRYSPTYKEDVALGVEYADKDLDDGGRAQIYEGTDTICADDAVPGGDEVDDTECGRGLRWKWSLTATTERLPLTRIYLQYRQSFEDGREDTPEAPRFDSERTARLRVTVRPSDVTSVVLYAAYYFGLQRDRGDVYYAPDKPKVNTYLELRQKLGAHFSLEGMLAYYHLGTRDADRYQDYLLYQLLLTGRY